VLEQKCHSIEVSRDSATTSIALETTKNKPSSPRGCQLKHLPKVSQLVIVLS